MSKKYDTSRMSTQEINTAIHMAVMHGVQRECGGTINVNVTASTSKPNSLKWACAECGASGEYGLWNAIPVTRHTRLTPNYLHKMELAQEVIQEICATWSSEQKKILDFYLFGFQHGKPIEQPATPIIDLVRHGMNARSICYAVIHSLNDFAEQEHTQQKEEAR